MFSPAHLAVALLHALPFTIAHREPTAKVVNGTVRGRYLPGFDQDLFLGIPFADAPRLDNPRPVKQAWTEPYDATNYGTTCYGFGSNKELNLTQGEDCLNLNIVRPHGYDDQSLPVLLWIYGGGFTQGSNADPMWNLSYIVQTSVENKQPIIAVSINYRLSFLGWPTGDDILEAGVATLALKDQRMSLQWLQENIGAFGGDPNSVTIWGESAGGSSVGWQLVSYGGEGGKGLFRAAIMHSGTMFGIASPQPASSGNIQYQSILNATECANLDCLRKVDIGKIYEAEASANGGPVMDGEFFEKEPAVQLDAGNVHRVPIMIGANQDEGLFFTNLVGPPATIGDLRAIFQLFAPSLTNETINAVLAAYPQGGPTPPYSLSPDYKWCKALRAANLTCTSLYRRTAAIVGDYFEDAPRRYVAEQWSKLGLPTYSFRFAADPTTIPIQEWKNLGPGFALHGADLAYDFRLPGGFTTPIDYYPPVKPVASHKYLSRVVASKIVSFAHSLDPNSYKLPHTPIWPQYDTSSPRNYVYNVSSKLKTDIHVERDDYREHAVQVWLSNLFEAYYTEAAS